MIGFLASFITWKLLTDDPETDEFYEAQRKRKESIRESEQRLKKLFEEFETSSKNYWQKVNKDKS